MQFDIELRTIDIMKVIEEEGSMVKAAAALNISQPALSSYIKRIENQLSFPLYNREKGRCFPTEAGNILLTEGKLLLKQYNSIIQKLELATHTGSVEIYLGWPMCYTVQYLHKIKPDIFSMKVNIKEDSVESLIQQLLEKRLNLLLIPAHYYHSNLIYKTLRHEEFYLAVPKDHIANKLISGNEHPHLAELSKLVDMPFISLYSQVYSDFVKPLFKEANYEPNVIFKCNSWDSSHSLVENGLGLTFVPYWFSQKENSKVNYYRIKSNCKTYRTFAFAYLRNQPITSIIKIFMDKTTFLLGDKYADESFDYSILNRKI